MPALALVLFIATRLHLEGADAVPDMLDLFVRAGVIMTAQELGLELPRGPSGAVHYAYAATPHKA